jgi:hypothetical protein
MVASDFVLAVNEAATNAVCRGSDRARLRLGATRDALYCEVRGGTLGIRGAALGRA